ncbi:hypothetical protein ACHAWF_017511 [Thalassiosira exigua]
MLRRGKIDPDPRSQVLHDLSTFMAELRQEGYEVWLMMDASEANMEGNAFNKFVQKNYLHDPHEQNASRPTTTRMGSTSIIDYMLCTEGILQYVRATGYRPLHEGIHSDHVMLWADVDLTMFFGNSSPAVNPPGKREFNCSNSIMCDRFLANLKDIYSHNRLPDRIRRLEAEIKLMGINDARVKKYDSLDKELVELIKAAAKKTVRVNRGYDRSPALTEARERVNMWKSVLTSARHAIPITKRARSIAAKHDIDLEFHERSGTSIKTLQRCVQDSWEHLKECQCEAQNLRSLWMSSLARYKASEDDDEEAARILKRIARNLHNCKMHRTLTHWIKGAHAGLEFIKIPTAKWYYSESMDELYHYDKGVFEAHAPNCDTQCHFFQHHVLKVIPDDAREVKVCYEPEGIRRVGTLGRGISWKRLTEKSEMEAHLLRRNKRHLQQVAMEPTPPSQGYFESILSEFGTLNAADDLLEGETTNDMTQFPPVVRTWLGQFRRNDDDRKCYPITGMIHTDEFQAAFRSNERWATSIDVMLEKKPGVRHIHQLRIIGLVEADFNTALKLFFTKHLVSNTKMTELTEEQWGGRPGRTAVEPALRKILAFEYGRIMYVTVALFANDATACFDRMVPNISALISRKSGMSKSVVRARNKVMTSMKHSICTSHGESQDTFCHEPGDVDIHGEGQGKGDVASLWSILSHTILRAHQELHEGLVLPHVANVMRLIAKNNHSFVDDTDAMVPKCSSSFYLSEKLTVQHLEKDAQLWADLIRASGGSIAQHKCV